MKISDFCIYMCFLTDFMEGVRDFRVVGDPSAPSFALRSKQETRYSLREIF